MIIGFSSSEHLSASVLSAALYEFLVEIRGELAKQARSEESARLHHDCPTTWHILVMLNSDLLFGPGLFD